MADARLSDIVVAGYFPPPTTGQSVATERLASLLGPLAPVHRVSLMGTHGLASHALKRPTLAGAVGYVRAARRWRHELRRHPGATVLWASLSPKASGHLRDALLVQPTFLPSQRVFGVVHWGIFGQLGEPLGLGPSVRRTIDRLAGVVFLDPGLARDAPFVPEAKRFVVPNTVADEVIASPDELAERRARRSRPGPLRVLFFSNMFPEKGYDTVLAAMGRLHRRGAAVEATFAGAWPEPAEAGRFERTVAREGIGEVVRYVGAVRERSAVRHLLLAHDVFAFPSRYHVEAQPLVLLEALACGMPIVTTAIGGIPLVVDDGVEGRFVRVGDADGLADALAAFADVPTWRAASEAARARFDRQFSPASVREAWRRLLTDGPR